MDSFRMSPTTDMMSTEPIDINVTKARNDSTDSLEDSADDTILNDHGFTLDKELSFGSNRGESSSSSTTIAVITNDGVHGCKWNGCERTFGLLDEMVSHVNDDHVRMEDVDYTCRWEGCTRRGRGFNARYKMLIHMRTHTNERPHQCHTCGKCFSRLENLKIHTRSHTGEKPYICTVKGCNKAYSNSSDRFKHTRTHFVDKPFVCKKDGCGKRYTDPSSLRKHMKTYGHREDDTTVSFATVDIDAASLVNCELGLNGNIQTKNHEQSSVRQLYKRKGSNTSKVTQIGPLDLTMNHGEDDELQITWQLRTTK